jgi:hypothetical protein
MSMTRSGERTIGGQGVPPSQGWCKFKTVHMEEPTVSAWLPGSHGWKPSGNIWSRRQRGAKRIAQSGILMTGEEEEEGEIEDFFGQLWWVPPTTPPRVCSSTNLVWIRRDL